MEENLEDETDSDLEIESLMKDLVSEIEEFMVSASHIKDEIK